MKTVLVTGASGFIGFAHRRVFRSRRGGGSLRWSIAENQTVFDSSSKLGKWKLYAVISVKNLRSGRFWNIVAVKTGGAPLDAIAHCAGRASDVGWASAFRRDNFDSVRFLGEGVNEAFARRFVFVSSTDVYGLLNHHRAEEDHTPLRAVPRNPYPHYKIRAEAWIRQNLSPRLWSIVRPAAVWGPNDPTLTGRIIDFLRVSPFIVHFGSWRGKNRWPLAHVDNVAQAIFLAATLDVAAGQSVNVADSEHTTIDEFYRLLATIYYPKKKYRTISMPFWTGYLLGMFISGVSNLLNRRRPFMDPSLYALYSVSRDLDFDNRRWLQWMAAADRHPITREEALGQLRHQL